MWVYRSDLVSAGDAVPATAVLVHDERGKFLGTALYSSASQIALRLTTRARLTGDDQLLALIKQRAIEALAYRHRLPASAQTTNAGRLIYSEADNLPGLIVDRYNDVLSLQTLTQAMDRDDMKQAVAAELLTRLAAEGVGTVVERVEPRIRELENLPPAASRVLYGSKTSTIYSLNRIKFLYDAVAGQKTGAFLDQRENYAAAQNHAKGAALDVFCYQGGFALHLARKCNQVTGVDSSLPALEVAEQNAALNLAPGQTEIEWMEANAFDLLRDYAASGRQYDTIVLDPPAFAKSKHALPIAMRGYKELNLRALKMLAPGGILITCSCSYHVSETDFQEMLASAAADAGTRLWIMEKRGQASDHPVLLSVPETSYLKCIICMHVA